MTRALLLVNTAVAAFTLVLSLSPSRTSLLDSRYYDLVRAIGFQPSEPHLLDSFASMFLHADIAHLLGNLLFLWIYGPNVERRLGRLPFLLLYLTAGTLANLGYALLSLGSEIPVIGASGAISGILGAYLIFFPSNRIHFIGPFFIPIRLPAWLVLLAFFAWDNLLPYLLVGGASPIAHAAHLAGFVAGMALAVGLELASTGGGTDDGPAERYEHAMALWEQGLVIDAHRQLGEIAAGGGRWGLEATTQRTRLEADPAFQRAARVTSPR